MKKGNLPYIAAALVILGLIAVIIANPVRSKKTLDQRESFKHTDKIPYGCAVAFKLLSSRFPASDISFDRKEPGEWQSITSTSYDQAVILMTKGRLEATSDELDRLLTFARLGNTAFVVASSFSSDASNFFGLTNWYPGYVTSRDTAGRRWLRLELDPFNDTTVYGYPGLMNEGASSQINQQKVTVLGRRIDGSPNFLRYQVGQGAIYLHTDPYAFSNYFLLYGNNSKYFEQVISVLPMRTTHVLWNEYYLNRPPVRQKEKDTNKFRIMMKYPAFRWGLFTGLALLFLYLLLGSRRKQRKIPWHQKPQNETLDFVKTIGRLYHDRSDHHNLARKMSSYFLEHVRSTYKISTQDLNSEFITTLHQKSGYPEQDVKDIINFIDNLESSNVISEQQLAGFHKQLESFYQKS